MFPFGNKACSLPPYVLVLGLCIDLPNKIRCRDECTLCHSRSETRQLALKHARLPTPEFSHGLAAFTIEAIVLSTSAFFLVAAARGDLFGRPFLGPSEFASIDPIMRFTRLLPIPDRRVKAWAAVGLSERPFRRTQKGL